MSSAVQPGADVAPGGVIRLLDRASAFLNEGLAWAAAAMALALGTVQRHKGHVAMELVVVKMGRRSRALTDASMALISLVLFAIVAFYVVRYGRVLHETGSLSETLRIIVYPWVYVVGLGCAGLTLALLVDFLRSVTALMAALRH